MRERSMLRLTTSGPVLILSALALALSLHQGAGRSPRRRATGPGRDHRQRRPGDARVHRHRLGAGAERSRLPRARQDRRAAGRYRAGRPPRTAADADRPHRSRAGHRRADRQRRRRARQGAADRRGREALSRSRLGRRRLRLRPTIRRRPPRMPPRRSSTPREAQAGVARNEAGYSVLLADADGVVVETLAEPGQVVAAGQTVVRLAHAGPREATISLPETIRPAIGSTASASVFNAAASGSRAPAPALQRRRSADPHLRRALRARRRCRQRAARRHGDDPAGRRQGGAARWTCRSPRSSTMATGRACGSSADRRCRSPGAPCSLPASATRPRRSRGGLEPGERFVALGAHLLHQGEARPHRARIAVEAAR